MKRLALLLVALTACARPADGPKPGGTPPAARKPKVTAAAAETREIEYTVEATGSIEAAEEISIPARVSGVLDAVSFKEGDTVDEKTVLAEIEVERYRIVMERADADLSRTRAQAQLAETLHTNRLKLYEEGKKQNKEWVTEEQMATLRADVEKAKADVQRATSDLELAKRDHEHARVRPPIAGIINGKMVSKGEYVKTETVVATILNVGTLHVRFTVPELEASRLSMDQQVLFSVRTTASGWLKAKLFYMSQKADAATRSVECKAEVLDRPPGLRAGFFASVKIVIGRQKSIVVPDRAVLPTDRGFVVYVLNEGKVKSRVVKLGLRVEDGRVEVLEGLAKGDRIVIDGAASLREGAAVDAVEEGPK